MAEKIGETGTLPVINADTGSGVQPWPSVLIGGKGNNGSQIPMGGRDNDPAPSANPDGIFGMLAIAYDTSVPVPTYSPGDSVVLRTDLDGNLLTTTTITPFSVETDDNSLPFGQDSEDFIGKLYIANGASDWIRMMGGVDNAAFPTTAQPLLTGLLIGDATAYSEGDISVLRGAIDKTAIGTAGNSAGWLVNHSLLRAFDKVASDWKRLGLGVHKSPGPPDPNILYVGGNAGNAFPSLTPNDAATLFYTTDNALLVSVRNHEPHEIGKSQAPIPAGGSLTLGPVQQNSLFAGSRGQHSLQFILKHDGPASVLHARIDISIDNGVTFVTTDTYTAPIGTVVVVRGLCIALGNRVRIVVTNPTGASATGVNVAAYLTHGA